MRFRAAHRIAALLMVTLIAGIWSPVPAAAHAQSKTDGNDVRGPLDIASVTVEHDASDVIFTFTTFRRWRIVDLGPSSFFVILIDRDQDGDFDRCGFIDSSGGILGGVVTNCRRRYVADAPTSKVSPRAVSITLGVITVDGTHEWLALSRYDEDRPCDIRACVDFAPNRRPYFHDIVPPDVAWVTTTTGPQLSTQLSSTTTVPVQVTANDLDTEVVEVGILRLVNEVWTEFASGLPVDTDTYDLLLAEGETYRLRPTALDAHGNEGTGGAMLVMHVPYDDAHADMSYASSWTSSPDAGSFQGTIHSSSTAGASLTFTFTLGVFGGNFRVLGGPGNGTASVVVDGIPRGTMTETPSTSKSEILYGELWATQTTHTVSITVQSGTFVIDGIAVAR